MYIAPEVIATGGGKRKCARSNLNKSDCWSLGIVAYELLSNSNPWGLDLRTCSFPKMCHIVANEQPMKSRVMSDQYWEVVKKLLVLDCEQRYSPAEALSHPLFDGVRNKLSNHKKLFPKGEKCCHEELKGFVKHTVTPNSLYKKHKAPVLIPVAPARRLFGSPNSSPSMEVSSLKDRLRKVKMGEDDLCRGEMDKGEANPNESENDEQKQEEQVQELGEEFGFEKLFSPVPPKDSQRRPKKPSPKILPRLLVG